MIAIAAMDIIDGACVRLSKGDYDTKRVYGGDPLEMARSIESSGVKYLHLVDLDGVKAGHVVNHQVLRRIAQGTSLIIDTGGGLKSAADFELVFAQGASQATVGSLAATDRQTTLRLLEKWGDRLILGADCRDGMIAVSGWSHTTELSVEGFVREYLQAGFKRVVSTDIARDGMLSGPAIGLYRQLLASLAKDGLHPELVASGGIRNLEDLDGLAQAGLYGAIVGKAMYEGALSATDLARWQAAQEG